MKNSLNSIIFYFTSLIAAASGVFLIVLTLNALMTGLALKDPNHFKTIGWVNHPTFAREMLLSEKAFASALFAQDLDQDPQAIKIEASMEYKSERPKILQAEAKRAWRGSAKWFVSCFFIMLLSYALSRIFGRMISRSYPEFIDKKVITSIMGAFLILYAGGRVGIWAFNTTDTYFKEESVFTEKDIEHTMLAKIKKIESGALKTIDNDNDQGRGFPKGEYYDPNEGFSKGEMLALTDQKWSFLTLTKLIPPLIEYAESRKEGDYKKMARFVDDLKKRQKFYAQQDFYSPAQIGFLINQHNESVRDRTNLIYGVLAGLLGVGLLFFRRSRHEAEGTS